jgi:ABC-type multidrug transport system fused ATPase/permease subunit
MFHNLLQRAGIHRLVRSLKSVLSGPLRTVRLHLALATVLALGAASLQGSILLLIQQLFSGILPTTSQPSAQVALNGSSLDSQQVAVLILTALLAAALLEFSKERVIFKSWRMVERSNINVILDAVIDAQARGAFEPNQSTEKSLQSLLGVSSRLGALTRVVASGFAAAASSFAFLAIALTLDLRLGLLLLVVIVPVAVANLAIVGRKVTTHARNVSLLASEARSDLTSRLFQAASGSDESFLPPLGSWRRSAILARSMHSVGRLQVISNGRLATSVIFALTIAGLIWFSLSSPQPGNTEISQVILVTIALIAALRQFSITLSNLMQTARFLPAVDQYEAVRKIIETSKTPRTLREELESATQRFGVSSDSILDEDS